MKNPIQSGDSCIVVGGLGQHKSPNLGLTVKAQSLRGDHSRFGFVWRCTGRGLKQLSDSGGYLELHWADIPARWLKKIEPDNLNPATKEVENSLST